MDEHDQRLLSHVRPADHRNPSPAATRYDLVVIGGGTAGLVCAAGAAGLGARVALVERDRLGGDCLNTGCVPSKALLRSSRVVEAAREGSSLGVPASAEPNFSAVMTRLRSRRADLAPHDSVARLVSLGVDVFLGTAAFSGSRTISVKGLEHNASAKDSAVALHFRKAVIATGSRPEIPAIPGLRDTPFLTSETLFDLRSQPRSLAIVGGGPIGCEMAQAFALLGTRVSLFERAGQLLPREDADAARLLASRLRDDGVDVWLRAGIQSVRHYDRTFILNHGQQSQADALLIATGRVVALDALALDAAGVRHDASGVLVDDRLRTSNRHVYAAGDVCSRFKFTHAADAMARIVIQNALFHGRKRVTRLIVPWCTFTSPEVAHVGSTNVEAAARGAATVTIPLDKVDRAVIDEATTGFLRVHHERGRIVGATIVGRAAGELITTVAIAIQRRWRLGDFASVIAPYPTVSTALRQAADDYRRHALTPSVRRMLRYYFQAFR